MTYVLIDGCKTAVEPSNPAEIHHIELSVAEWCELQAREKELRKPWIRNANVDRDIRPARSASGYVLLAVRGAKIKNPYGKSKPGYRLDIETPYRLDAFTFKTAEKFVRDSLQTIAEQFGYAGYQEAAGVKEDMLSELQMIADHERREYYTIQALALRAPEQVLD